MSLLFNFLCVEEIVVVNIIDGLDGCWEVVLDCEGILFNLVFNIEIGLYGILVIFDSVDQGVYDILVIGLLCDVDQVMLWVFMVNVIFVVVFDVGIDVMIGDWICLGFFDV